DTLWSDFSSTLFKRMDNLILDDWKSYRELAALSESEDPESRKEADQQNIECVDSLIHLVPAMTEERNAIQFSSYVLRSRIRDKNDELLFSEMQRLQRMHDEESSAAERWTFLWIALAGLVYGSALLLAVLYRKQKGKAEEGLDSLFFTFESTLNPVQIVRSDGTTRYANPAFYKWSGSDPDNAGNDFFLQTVHGDADMQNISIWETAKPALHRAQSWSGEILRTRPDGQTAVADILIVPFIRRNENILDYIVFYTDTTKKKEYAQKLEETQKLYKNIVEGSLDGLMVVQNNALIFANPKAVSIFGYESTDDMQRVPFADLLHFDEGETFSAGNILSESISLGKAEFRCRTKNANIIDVEAHTLPIDWEGQAAVLISFHDVTERKMMERERALCVWEQEKLSEIDKQLVGTVELENILDAIIQQTMKLTKSGFAGILIYDSESTTYYWKGLKGNVHEFSGDWIEAAPEFKILAKRNEMTILGREGNKEEPSLRGIPELSSENIATAAFFPLQVEKALRGFFIVGYPSLHDFSDKEIRLLNSLAEKCSIAMVNAKSYDDLLEHEKELKLLSASRVQVQEEERRRIAREIHDGLGQLLTAIKFNLEILEDTISTTPDEQNRINDMKKLLDDVMKEARELSYSLMPSVLEDFGLIPAMQLLCEQFSQQTGIHVQFLPHGDPDRFGIDLEIGIYRIAQEALMNIQKHASATNVELQIIVTEHAVRMTVEDNGKGFAAAQKIIRRQTGRKGIGLMKMRERTSLLDGIFSIESALKHGTLLCVEIPIPKKESKP
ncbi:MAG: PAS domain S-box protein, partial [Bacteroidota bacterium]